MCVITKCTLPHTLSHTLPFQVLHPSLATSLVGEWKRKSGLPQSFHVCDMSQAFTNHQAFTHAHTNASFFSGRFPHWRTEMQIWTTTIASYWWHVSSSMAGVNAWMFKFSLLSFFSCLFSSSETVQGANHLGADRRILNPANMGSPYVWKRHSPSV